MRRVLSFLKRALQIAYVPSRAGIAHKGRTKRITAKIALESLSALLALYAAYADISQRFLDFLPLTLPPHYFPIARAITGVLGILVCGHLLYSTERNGTLFTYARIPRVIAGIVVWVLVFAVGFSLSELRKTPDEPVTAMHEVSYEIPSQQWEIQPTPSGASTNIRTYSTQLKLPQEIKGNYRDLIVYVVPLSGYILNVATPKTEKPLPTDQEPLQQESSENTAKWLLPEFHEELDWRLSVSVKTNAGNSFPTVPFRATMYLSK